MLLQKVLIKFKSQLGSISISRIDIRKIGCMVLGEIWEEFGIKPGDICPNNKIKKLEMIWNLERSVKGLRGNV